MSNRVAIPRLLNQNIRCKPGRTGRACDECRSRKAKCDGSRPTCYLCSRQQIQCHYSETKRTRERTELELTKQRADNFEKVLREILREVDHPIAKKIEKVLKLSSRDPDMKKNVCISSVLLSPSSDGSLDDVEVLDEDLNRCKDSRSTGYLGKTSEVAWMRSLDMQTGEIPRDQNGSKNDGRSPLPQAPTAPASVNYHIEPADYPAEELDKIYTLPEKPLAEQLLGIYLESVQPSLPILRPDLFTEQFNSFYSGRSSHPGRKWLAMLNLIFAISAKLCQLSGQDTQKMDHQFFSRAQMLNLSESIVENHEDLQQVQLETLAAFYLLTSSHISRAWKMIGIATRSSISLGLHLRATHSDLSAQALEARNMLFWSIFSLESLLSVMTGRVSGLGSSYYSAPPPLASPDMCPFSNNTLKDQLDGKISNPPMKWTLDQEHKQLEVQRSLTRAMEATHELYFFCLVDLQTISHSASGSVYSKEALKLGWDEIQHRIDFYNEIMLDWRSGLPDSLIFDPLNPVPLLSPNDASRVSLALHYHSARIVLNRPCLARKKNGRKFKGHLSRARRDIEMACLNSALAIISIFPDEPSTSWFRCVTWWSVVHFLVQSTSIFLINISCANSSQQRDSTPTGTSDPSDNEHFKLSSNPPVATGITREAIITATKKALTWLFYLGKSHDSARRTFNLCNNCIRRMESSCTDLAILTVTTYPCESTSTSLDVPTDQVHQQYRSKKNASVSQFAGTRGFGFDHNGEIDTTFPPLEVRKVDDSGLIEPSIGTLVVDTDMSDYIPDPETTTLDTILEFLA